MKYRIEYYSIQSDHIFATPEFESGELIEADNWDKVVNYITEQKDSWGHRYRINENFKTESLSSEYQFISNAGGVIVNEYVEPEFKKI